VDNAFSMFERGRKPGRDPMRYDFGRDGEEASAILGTSVGIRRSFSWLLSLNCL